MPSEKKESFFKKYSYVADWLALTLLVLFIIWYMLP